MTRNPAARIVLAATSYFGCVFGAGFILGIFRVPLLVPRLGVRAAELIEMPIMIAVVVVSARFVIRRFDLPRSVALHLLTGCIALALVIVAELSFALILGGGSVASYVAGRDPVSGSVYLAVLILFAIMPVFVTGRPMP